MISLLSKAANIKPQGGEPYTMEDFLAIYPAFKGQIPDAAMEMYIDMANRCITRARWKGQWELGIGLFIAHFCTLYLQSMTSEGASAEDILSKVNAVGLIASESADGVSYSRDTSSLSDLQGWAGFKLTAYGVQFATLARMIGKGGMYVY